MLPERGGVIVARRRSPEVAPDPTVLWCPDWLRAGPCFEVWTPEGRRPDDDWPMFAVRCSHRFRSAKYAYLDAHGLDPRSRDARIPPALREGSAPWSFRSAVENGMAADRLARLGLPGDWRPSPAPRAVLQQLPTYGYDDPPAEVVRLMKGP